jgi:hypothetical protein
MYIALEDSCSKSFRKWSDVYRPEINKNVRADEADGNVSADSDLDHRVMTSPDPPHRPWLVPGTGRL